MACASSKLSRISSSVSDARTWRRLAFAAAVSGAVHAATIALGRVDLPEPAGQLPPLAVRIVSAPAAAAPQAAAPVPLQRAPASVRSRAPRVATIQPLLQMQASSSFTMPVEEPSEPGTLNEAPVGDVPAPVASTEPVVVATAPPTTYVPEMPPLRSLPRKGRITYNLVYGRDRFPVGRTVQTWEMDSTRYRLASRSETTGIVDLFRSQHRTFMSRGSLTPRGLRPETFLMSRNRGRGPEQARAKFDWDAANIRLEGGAAPRNESLPQNTQDLLSLMYQLSLDPPAPGRFRQTVTNGARIETFDLDALPEETIQTPLGALRALPIKQVRKAGEESLELWLATEYRYLPVRIRFFDRDGEPQGEQLVTEIRLSDE
jgi:hypothetical protein